MRFLRNQRMSKDYYLWFAGDTIFDFGSAIQQTAIPLVAFAVTQSPKTAGLIAMMMSIGKLVAIIPSGVIADYYDRRRTLMLFGTLDALAAVLLAVLLFTGRANLTWLMILGFIAAILGTIVGITNNALLKNVVTTEQFPTAISLNQGREAAISIIGGPAGGALFALSSALPTAIYSLTTLVRAVTIQFIKTTGNTATRNNTNPLVMLTAGLKIVIKEPSLRSLMLIASLINFAGIAIFLTIILDLQERHTPPALIGSVFTVISLGALVGAPLAGYLMHKFATGKLIIAGFILESLSMTLLAVSPNILWVLGCLFLAVLALPTINGAVTGFLMGAVPSEFQGRVSSAAGFLSLALSPLASVTAGFMLADWGREAAILVNGLVFLIALVIAVINPGIRAIPLPENWENHGSSIRKHCEALNNIEN